MTLICDILRFTYELCPSIETELAEEVQGYFCSESEVGIHVTIKTGEYQEFIDEHIRKSAENRIKIFGLKKDDHADIVASSIYIFTAAKIFVKNGFCSPSFKIVSSLVVGFCLGRLSK